MLSKNKSKHRVSAIIPKTSYVFTVILRFFVSFYKTLFIFPHHPLLLLFTHRAGPLIQRYVGECRRLIEPRSWFRTRGDIWVLALLAPVTLSMLQIQRSSCRLNTSINLYLPGRGIRGRLLWDFPGTAGSAAAEPPSEAPDVHNISGTRVRPFPSTREAASREFFHSFGIKSTELEKKKKFHLLDKHDLKARLWLKKMKVLPLLIHSGSACSAKLPNQLNMVNAKLNEVEMN